jgi:hypothetical protein
MPRRCISILLSFLLVLSGCSVHKMQMTPAASLPQPLPHNEAIVGVTTLSGEDLQFDQPVASINGGVLFGHVKKKPVTVPVDHVQRYWVRVSSISTARTVGLIAGVTAGVVIVAVAAAKASSKSTPVPVTTGCTAGQTNCVGSCPFVYSWDGTHYIFDAEPYGGAIARGLEKDDYSELSELKEEAGFYKLRMTNEVDETQMTNLTELWVVDHPAGSRVVPDMDGHLHTVSAPQTLLSAQDASGRDLLPWLRSTDRLIWEPPPVPDESGSLQNDIVMTFPKPAGASQAKLVTNVATGLWGGAMVKQIAALRGRNLGRLYFELNHSSIARNKLARWEEREQIYRLPVYVEEPTGWHVRGVIPGTSAFISKDRILPLDVSHVQGDRLRIRIHPPAGFWALNSFAVDYTPDRPVSVQRLAPARAVDRDGINVLPALASVDRKYYEMPGMGDSADMSFATPPVRAGSERTLILHSRGYYKLHIAETGEPDKATLRAFDKVPGSVVRFAAEQYNQSLLAKEEAH